MIDLAPDTHPEHAADDALPLEAENLTVPDESVESDLPPRTIFTLAVTGGTMPISAITGLSDGKIAVISDGVARWLVPDGTPGGRIGGRPRCTGRAVTMSGWGTTLAIRFADPAGLAIITSNDEYICSFDGREMPVASGTALAMNATTLALTGQEPKLHIFDRGTMAISRTLRVPGIEHLAAAPDGAYWATIPRTGRLIRLGEEGDLTDALSGFGHPGPPAISRAIAAVPDRETGEVVMRAIDPAIHSNVISGDPLGSPTGVLVLPDGALLVSQETEPYLLRYEPPR
jgi:hypothetical protein